MAQEATPTPPETESPEAFPCCSERTFAYLILRILLASLLLIAGMEKFKSPAPPYRFQRANWHGEVVTTEVDGVKKETREGGRWITVAKPVFDFSGLDNPANFADNDRIPKTISWVFYYYAQLLPYAMIAAGTLILFGFLNRLALATGAFIWTSLALGQAMLPDNQTVMMLLFYVLLNIVALALVRFNRIAITRY